MRKTKYLKDDLNNIKKPAAIPVFRDFESEILGDLLKRSKVTVPIYVNSASPELSLSFHLRP